MKIITRGDFDGLACSVLLTDVEEISDIRFAHPKAVQDQEIDVSAEDIVVNLPYHPDCGMWFDHHISEEGAGKNPEAFKGKHGVAPSCARLIFDHYDRLGWRKYKEMLNAVDKVDSAQLDLNDILRPSGWVKLADTLDPRSGFKESNKYFMDLIGWVKEYPIEEILLIDDVRSRVREFFKQQGSYKQALLANSYLNGTVVVTDFRRLTNVPVGSRFLIYALYPKAKISVRMFFSDDYEHVFLACGHSILNRGSRINIGNLMAEYGGGGHFGAGSCRVTLGKAEDTLNDIVAKLKAG